MCIRDRNGLSFDVPDWVPVIGGDHFGFDLPEVGFGSIPYLAQGGYVKPNTPQPVSYTHLAIEQVLKDVPALKPSTENNEGFQIGAGQQTNGHQSSAGSNVNVPTKRWNRFN